MLEKNLILLHNLKDCYPVIYFWEFKETLIEYRLVTSGLARIGTICKEDYDSVMEEPKMFALCLAKEMSWKKA